ncbi:YqjF family protein [Euzebya rosea]|uniref:YqjF family protein n=1 Tax=Euzebya rosea TaxID=2052804 RepID=UPI000D3EB2EF|nr:DUF2071 domain-containing protein [Euzebya rosea]
MGAEDYPDRSPHAIGRAAATQLWRDVTMLHWRIDAGRLQALLPDGLEPDLFDGSAWASLVPFEMVDLTLPPLPAIPRLTTFPETNVRTYVRGALGPAVWFHSLDVTRAWMPPTARTLFGVPYTWSRMRILRRGPAGEGQELRYWCRRRWPRPVGATSLVGVRVGTTVAADDLDRFLVNRWAAYSMVRGVLHHAPVIHDPWPLHRAETTVVRDELGAAVGLPLADVERVRFSPSATAVVFDWARPVPK